MAEGPSKTFFSYAREDSEFVLRLVKDLRAAGAEVWLDQLDISPSMSWDEEVEKALHECPRHVIVLSPSSVNSRNVRDEFSFALNKGKQVIPLLLRECEIPYRLERVQYIDFRRDYDAALQELLKVLGAVATPGSSVTLPAPVKPVAPAGSAAALRVRGPEPVSDLVASLAAGIASAPGAQAAATGQARSFYRLGLNYHKNKRYDVAIGFYGRAIGFDPSYADAYRDRGRALADTGKYDQAIQDYDQLLKLRPDAAAYNYRGCAYHSKGQYDQALQDFDAALRLDPNLERAYYNRGLVYYDQNQYDRAIQEFDQALKREPTAMAYTNRGLAYLLTGKRDRAFQDYNEALKLEPNFAYAYNNRGVVYELNGEYKLAVQDFDQALKLDPNDATAQKNRDRVAAKLKK